MRSSGLRSLALIVAAASPAPAVASGWNDYELAIGGGFQIVRVNSFDICLFGRAGSIYFPREHPGAGPINAYAITADRVLLRTWGSRPRNSFPGDDYQETDASRQMYFLVDRSTERLTGPLSRPRFAAAITGGAPAWVEPANPNVLVPLAGAALFLTVSAMIFSPVWVPAALILRWAWRRKTRAPDRRVG